MWSLKFSQVSLKWSVSILWGPKCWSSKHNVLYCISIVGPKSFKWFPILDQDVSKLKKRLFELADLLPVVKSTRCSSSLKLEWCGTEQYHFPVKPAGYRRFYFAYFKSLCVRRIFSKFMDLLPVTQPLLSTATGSRGTAASLFSELPPSFFLVWWLVVFFFSSFFAVSKLALGRGGNSLQYGGGKHGTRCTSPLSFKSWTQV